METEIIEQSSNTGYEQFLNFKTQLLRKNNRSAVAFNQLTDDARTTVLMYANTFVSRMFDENDINKKIRFSDYSMPQKIAIIDSMNALQRAFRNIPRWLSETDAL